ncbi:glutathionylspermidine synthase family protein [Rheinheimera sp. UJ63]|uniref:glutathionylspermidine synthase family protein n=1 Tax=Rheinheimera sp. UJ63 TaxID=2910157 RepID=UPI001F33F18E|nr:glutathionylspermidine synthase family protein [Rheinheimera sp. UJ63]MCF4008756.1 glutathionylspermidine synthase family protein [Rheinheimera sp. UJ63]
MKRIPIAPRPGWQDFAESVGFDFHTIDGEAYWDESAYYQFSLAQIEQDLEAPTEELHQMALDLIPDILQSEQQLTQLAVPERFWDAVRDSWNNAEPHLYGRLDFAYNGQGPAKLLELNYDTPTSLYETGFFQWVWLEDQQMRGVLPAHADQFNSLQDKLEQAFAELPLPQPFYFSSVTQSIEDKGTVDYLMDIALQSGLDSRYIQLEQLGDIDGQLVDLAGFPIQGLFKLYPWEFMLQEEFAATLLTTETRFLEPLWKTLLSNKGILPLLWQKYQGHPNLLPSFFDDGKKPLTPGWVRKPLFSREGANIEMITPDGQSLFEPGPYNDNGYIRQAFAPLPRFGEHFTLIGSWVVGDMAAGIGIREDNSLITKDSSRFVPHIILD